MSPVNAHTLPALSRRRFLLLSAGAAMAAVSAARAGAVAAVTPNKITSASGAFLDAGVVHEIAVTFDQAAYDAMIEAFSNSGDKDWIEATVSIDGSTYPKAGMRLKGNSSLMGLRLAQGGGAGHGGLAGGFAGNVSADEPEVLPWLIRLDKYADDQQHNGVKELVIRSNASKTSLNEATALDLLAAAGLASQLAASTGFSVNGGAPALRLAIEHPNDDWMALRFSRDGLLYKGESTGNYSYRGDDPDSYTDVFDLEAGGSGDVAEDMKPLIEFLDFLNNSDDQTFTSEIAERLDVAQFAVYLAMMDLIHNFDDIAGPGNNAYLYLDPASKQFTVVPWDMNLALGVMGDVQPAGNLPEGERPAMPEGVDSGSMQPGSSTPVAENVTIGGGQGFPNGGPGEFGQNTNPLVKRFKAIADYSTLIGEQTSQLRAELYDSGTANDVLARWVGVLKKGAAAMVDEATITSESEAIAAYFKRS